MKNESSDKKEEVSASNNANITSVDTTTTTTATTTTTTNVTDVNAVDVVTTVGNVANVTSVDPTVMVNAIDNQQQPILLTDMDKSLYSTAPTGAEGLAASFSLPLGASVFPYDDPSMLKRPDININEMAFHLSNGGSASPMGSYPGYGFNPLDKMGHPGAPNATHLNGQAYPPAALYNRYGATPDGRVNPNAAATHYYNKVNPHYEHMNYNGGYSSYNPMGVQRPYLHRVYNNQTPLHKISFPQQYHMVKKK